MGTKKLIKRLLRDYKQMLFMEIVYSPYWLKTFTMKGFGGVTVRLEPDVAEMFPNVDAVKEA